MPNWESYFGNFGIFPTPVVVGGVKRDKSKEKARKKSRKKNRK